MRGHPGAVGQNSTAPSTAVGRMLVRVVCVESPGTGHLLGRAFAVKPYRCLDLLLEHRDELFGFLKGQWGRLFGAKYDVLLYDLTSAYFESDPPPAGSDSKKRFGYSRDKRSDCVQVVVA